MDLRSGQFVNSVALITQGRSLSLAVFCRLFFGLSFHAFRPEATIFGTVTGPSASVVPDVTIPSVFPGGYSGNRPDVTGKISYASLLKFAPSMRRPMIHSRLRCAPRHRRCLNSAKSMSAATSEASWERCDRWSFAEFSLFGGART
jgi:hypothetical protein